MKKYNIGIQGYYYDKFLASIEEMKIEISWKDKDLRIIQIIGGYEELSKIAKMKGLRYIEENKDCIIEQTK